LTDQFLKVFFVIIAYSLVYCLRVVCPHGTSANPAHGATRQTWQQSSEVEAAAAVPTPLKLWLLTRAPACPRLRLAAAAAVVILRL